MELRNARRNPFFTKQKEWAYIRKFFKESEKDVYDQLCFHANEDGESWPGVACLMQWTGFSKSTVQAATSRLAAIGLIQKESRHAGNGRQRSNVYLIADLSRIMDSVWGFLLPLGGGSDRLDGRVRLAGRGGSDRPDPLNKTSLEQDSGKKEKRKEPDHGNEKRAAEDQRAFTDLCKVAMDHGYVAEIRYDLVVKFWKQLSREERLAALTGFKRYLKWWEAWLKRGKPQGKFIDPHWYLRNGSWLNELRFPGDVKAASVPPSATQQVRKPLSAEEQEAARQAILGGKA